MMDGWRDIGGYWGYNWWMREEEDEVIRGKVLF